MLDFGIEKERRLTFRVIGLDAEKLLRLEHIIVAHQRLPEWGAPKPPMTLEALLVHYADDLDAKVNMVVTALKEDKTPGHTTSKKNVLIMLRATGPVIRRAR